VKPGESIANNHSAERRTSSFVERWTDVLVSPGDLFESLKGAPAARSNWVLPLLLVTAIGAMLALQEMDQRVVLAKAAPGALAAIAGSLELQKLNALAMVSLGNLLGMLWSALMLWGMGRVIFKATFGFMKAMEVVGLATVILALTMVVTHLLVAATGHEHARPALSLLIDKFDAANRIHVALGTVNVMHLWLAGVMTMGLAKLSDAAFGDAAFWVFGYWIGLRLILALLGAGVGVL
jgi:hypothetical protein